MHWSSQLLVKNLVKIYLAYTELEHQTDSECNCFISEAFHFVYILGGFSKHLLKNNALALTSLSWIQFALQDSLLILTVIYAEYYAINHIRKQYIVLVG